MGRLLSHPHDLGRRSPASHHVQRQVSLTTNRLCPRGAQLDALLNGHVLGPGDQRALEQETWALLTPCQLLRMAMVDAVETQPGTDPDRASFTSALETARDQLTAAAGVCTAGPAGQPGV